MRPRFENAVGRFALAIVAIYGWEFARRVCKISNNLLWDWHPNGAAILNHGSLLLEQISISVGIKQLPASPKMFPISIAGSLREHRRRAQQIHIEGPGTGQLRRFVQPRPAGMGGVLQAARAVPGELPNGRQGAPVHPVATEERGDTRAGHQEVPQPPVQVSGNCPLRPGLNRRPFPAGKSPRRSSWTACRSCAERAGPPWKTWRNAPSG